MFLQQSQKCKRLGTSTYSMLLSIGGVFVHNPMPDGLAVAAVQTQPWSSIRHASRLVKASARMRLFYENVRLQLRH